MPNQNQVLTPALELARTNKKRYPNESEEYRTARNALLAEEIELRRHIWRVAEQRRELPPGGEVTKDYRFDSKDGPRSAWPIFSVPRTRWWSTASCTGPSARRAARCARRK